jgi:HEAT repeat protein
MSVAAKPDYGVVLKQMNGAIRRLEMYPPGHPASMQAIEKPFSVLQQVLESDGRFIISRVEDKIVVNGKNIEGADLLKRFLEEFQSQDIDSVSIDKDLTKEDLGKFLGFFVKPLGKNTQTLSLPEYIKQNQINSIKVDQLRYELVEEDEVVVKSDVVEGADLKSQIAQMLKDDPDLLREMLLGKSGGTAGSAGGTGEGTGGGTGQGTGGGSGPGSGRGTDQGEGESSGSGAGSGEFKEKFEQHLQSLSDDELLSLLASSLERSIKSRTTEKQDFVSDLDQMAKMVNQLLQDREKDKLLPQIKKMLADKGIVKTEHLEYLFDERWLKSQEVLDELMRMIELLGTGEADPERFDFLWQRVIGSDDAEIKSYAIDKLLAQVESDNARTRSLVVSTLEETLSYFIQNKMEFEFSFIKERLYQRITDESASAHTFEACSRLLRTTFSELIAKHKFREANQILAEHRIRLNPQTDFPEDAKEVAADFVNQVSSDTTLSVLASELREGVAFQDLKTAEELLEGLEGDRVARKLLDVFTLDDRAARMSALRVLSRLGASSISAFSDLLSDAGNFAREPEGDLLVNDSWYKIRNVIYVLGNIPDPKSLELLKKLSRDADLRVRLEAVKALEKIAGPEPVKILLGLLEDREDQVRRHVITSLASLGEESALEPLKQHFRRRPEDRTITIAAVGKIGGEKSSEFLLNILWDKESSVSQLLAKARDEIQIAALGVLGKTGPPGLTSDLQRFVRDRRRGLRSLLVKDKVTEAANRALKALESRAGQSTTGVKEKATS